jgi:NAD+ kinase
MKKFHFVFDTTTKSKKLKKNILRYNKNHSVKKSDTIIVAGGDGFMLRTMKKYYKFEKPFYGINCGMIGFLMNKYISSNLIEKINKSKLIIINPLEIKVKNFFGKKRSFLAINDLSLFRQSKQTAFLNLKINKKNLIKKLIGDGILVSTPAGSTAYNLSIHGPILSLNSKKIAITSISPFRPRRWKGKIVSDRTKIFITNLDPKKRPVAAVADNNEIRNVIKVNISVNKKIKFKLLFNSNESLSKKIKLEQRKKIN